MFWCLTAIAAEVPDVTDVTEVVVVKGAREASSAAGTTLDRQDVVASPGRSADDLLRETKGLHQSAHSGHGKAYQYFLRGFDAVHGADLAIDLEGIPLNEVSNVHGHGYLDLYFLPRDLVMGAVLAPGVFTADVGDFGVAGSGSLTLGLARPGLSMEVGASTARSAGVSVGFRPEHRGPGTFGWVDVESGLGVGQSRRFNQMRAAVGMDGELTPNASLRTFGLVYRGTFESPGVVAEADYQEGRQGFYDAYANSGFGESSRAVGGAVLEARWGKVSSRTTAWAQWRDLVLQQNFTGSYEFPDTGDSTLQTHEGTSGGVNTQLSWRPTPDVGIVGGLDARIDRISQTEAGVDRDDIVWDERIDADIDQRSLGAFLAIPLEAGPLRVEPGIRAQGFQVALERRLDNGIDGGSAKAFAPAIAPRINASLTLGERVVILAGTGRGFRSPEARGVEEKSAPVSVADGAEIGSRVAITDAISIRIGTFGTWVSNEIRFDHAAARFLTTGSTRRLGGYAGVTVDLTDAITAELDVTGSDGRYRVDLSPIPYAPRWLVVGTLRTDALVLGPWVTTAGIRSWWLSQRPLPGGHASHAAMVTDLTVQARLRKFTVDLDITNLFATRWRDGEFFYASNWNDSPNPPALAKRHFTAGAPFELRLAVGFTL